MNHRATLRGSYGTINALKLTRMPWRGPPIFRMGDPFRVLSLQHHPPHGLASRASRGYYQEVPSGLPETSFVSILVGKRTRPLLVAPPFLTNIASVEKGDILLFCLPRVAAVQNVVANPPDGSSCGSWHSTMLP